MNTIWLPVEIWSDLLVDFCSVKDICHFMQINHYTNWIGRSDLIWGPIFRRTIASGTRKKRKPNPVARVPQKVVTMGKTLSFHNRYVRLLYWFYETEIRKRGDQYPLSLTINRPRKLRAIEATGLIPPGWRPRIMASKIKGSSVYQRKVPEHKSILRSRPIVDNNVSQLGHTVHI